MTKTLSLLLYFLCFISTYAEQNTAVPGMLPVVDCNDSTECVQYPDNVEDSSTQYASAELPLMEYATPDAPEYYPETVEQIVIQSDSTHIDDSLVYISLQDFVYAGDRRYTMDASLPRKSTDIKTWSLIGFSSIYVGICAALHIYQANTIWDSTSSFRFIEDGDYALYADKFGHVWGTYINAYLASEAMIASGFSPDDAALTGAGIALLYQTYVEVLDGFGKYWGFSWSDMYANFGGIAWFLAQHYIPFLQNFTYKTNFTLSSWRGEANRAESHSFIDDYSAWTFTLSADMYNLVPSSWQSWYPKWLNLDIGFAARNLTYKQGDVKYIVGLDIDPVRLLPDGPNLWNWFRQGFRYIKFPAPAIEFGNVTRFHLLYPFRINIGPISF